MKFKDTGQVKKKRFKNKARSRTTTIENIALYLFLKTIQFIGLTYMHIHEFVQYILRHINSRSLKLDVTI